MAKNLKAKSTTVTEFFDILDFNIDRVVKFYSDGLI